MTSTKFFDAYRLKYGALKQGQVDGLNSLLSLSSGIDKRYLAYMLATVKHECADTYQPITERGSRDYFSKYEPHTRIGDRLGNIEHGDGYRYRGRGYVQITGLENYRRLGNEIGVNLVDHPELALHPENAYKIMYYGMTKGLFTGKKLSDYITTARKDYVQARRIINGMDRAQLIADYSTFFESIL